MTVALLGGLIAVAFIAALPAVLSAAAVATELAATEGAMAATAELLAVRASTAEVVAAAESAGFTGSEAATIAEAQSLMNSPVMRQLVQMNSEGRLIVVEAGEKIIQYQPDLPSELSGMTLFGANGFVVGPTAFKSSADLTLTILHEMYRLNTSAVPDFGITGMIARSETRSAFEFAKRAWDFLQSLAK